MSTKSYHRGFTWGGLSLAAAAALAFVTVSAAVGDDAGEKIERKTMETKIQLVLDQDGESDRLTMVDLHELAVGDSRSLETEGGRPVLVTRDEEGFEVDLDGKKIRVADVNRGMIPSIAPGERRRFEKRIVIDGDDASGEPRTMVFHTQDGEPGDVVVMKRSGGPEGSGFAWSSNGGELPLLGIDGTIARLEKSAKFQELDAATRAKVLEALRESAPAIQLRSGKPGERVMVIEVEDESADEE